MQDQAVRLTIEMAVNEPGSFDGQRHRISGDPSHDGCEQVGVVRQVVATEAAIDVGRDDTRCGCCV